MPSDLGGGIGMALGFFFKVIALGALIVGLVIGGIVVWVLK